MLTTHTAAQTKIKSTLMAVRGLDFPPWFERVNSFLNNKLSVVLSFSSEGAEFYSGESSRILKSKERLDWKALDRAARLIAKASVAPVRRRKGQEVPRASEIVEDYNGTLETSVVSPVRSRDFSSGAVVGLVHDMVPSIAGRDVTSTAEHEAEDTRVEKGTHWPRRGVAGRQASSRAAPWDVKEWTQARVEGNDPHAAALAEVTPVRVSRSVQSGATLDLADFAALGGASYSDMSSATGIGQMALTTRAAALSSPTWMGGASAGPTSRAAKKIGRDYAPAVAGSDSDTGRTVDGRHAPAYAAPTWMRAEPWLVKASRAGQVVGDGLEWLKPTQDLPAAPYNASTATAAQSSRTLPVQWDHGTPFSPSLRTQTADAWVGPARGSGQVSVSENASPAGFDAMEDTPRQVLDEMTRLASRPPAGVTSFDAGQMPAWLSGWTGGV